MASTRFKDSIEELSVLIRSKIPLIWVLTHEEQRLIDILKNTLCKKEKLDVFYWTGYEGLTREKGQVVESEQRTTNPITAIEKINQISIADTRRGALFFLKDFHQVLQEPLIRQLKDLYCNFINQGKTLIIIAPELAHGPSGSKPGLPLHIEKYISVVRFELPTYTDISDYINYCTDFLKKQLEESGKPTSNNMARLEYSQEEKEVIIRSLQGLTFLEIEDATSQSFKHLKELNPVFLASAKKQIIRKSDILEYIDQEVNIQEVGGLDIAKDYLQKYALAYTKEAEEYGVEPLKAVLIVGCPGTGKSLLCKAIKTIWKLPLLRLDLGRVMAGIVGSSEARMREMILQTESISPCILHLDEVEKSLSGTKSSNFSDGGTLSRVFGTLLTAMQEGMKGVTILATANNISALPPEFIRRFNEVFFVDLPSPEEQWDIFKIHLQKRKRSIKAFESDRDKILQACVDYTGAEIEKAIQDAIAAAFYQKQNDIATENLLQALSETKPISKVMAPQITELRQQARGQYRYASSYSEKQNKTISIQQGKKLDLLLEEVGRSSYGENNDEDRRKS